MKTRINQKILKNNILIANFMNLNILFPDSKIDFDKDKEKIFYLPEHLCYHCSWDWLIPVLNKCYKIWKECNLNSRLPVNFWNEIDFENINYSIFENNIKNVFNSVIEFVKWYNQNKKEFEEFNG